MIARSGLTGILELRKGELPKLSLYCSLDKEDRCSRVREDYG